MLWRYRNSFVHKENKNNYFIQCLRHILTRVPRRMRVHFSACKQGTAHACSPSERQLLHQQHHTHALWFSRKWWRTDPEKRKALNKVIKKSILRASKNCSWTTDVTWTILTMSLLCFWALNVPLLTLQGQKALGFHQKHLHFHSKDERGSYEFGTIWRE